MKDDKIYLVHILDSVNRIKVFTKAGKKAFQNSLEKQDAVIRNFEIIGEATKKLSDELRKKHHEVPWRLMAGLRDVLIHDYATVDINEIWGIAEKELGKIEKSITAILKTLETK